MPTQSFDKASVKILLLINPKFKPKNSIPEPYCQATHEVVKWEISTQDHRQCWMESANRRLLRILTFMATLVGHGDGAFDATTSNEARSNDREVAVRKWWKTVLSNSSRSIIPDHAHCCRWSIHLWKMEFTGKVKKGASGRKGGGPKKNSASRSIKTGLQFPVGRIGRCLKKGRHSQRIGTDVLVYLVVVLEWMLLSELQLEVYCLHWKRWHHGQLIWRVFFFFFYFRCCGCCGANRNGMV